MAWLVFSLSLIPASTLAALAGPPPTKLLAIATGCLALFGVAFASEQMFDLR